MFGLKRKVYFSDAELTCDCCGGRVEKKFEKAIIRVRKRFKNPMRVTSSFRCEAKNKEVGGSPRSKHKLGLAIDVSMYDVVLVHKLMTILLNEGFSVGVYEKFLHIDKFARPEPIVFRGAY